MKFQFIAMSLVTTLLLGTIGCSGSTSSDKAASSDKADTASTVTLEAVPTGSIHNVHRLGDVWFGGQPSAEDFVLLKNMGIKTVVNLRHAAENEELNETQLLQDAGLTYVNIPFAAPTELTDDVFDAVRNELQTAARPLLLHCASANRVGATWLPYRVLDEGIALEEALREAKQIGLRSPAYEERAQQYIAARQEK